MSTGTAIVSVNLGMPSDLRGLARFAAGLAEDYVGDLFLVNGKTGEITSGSQGFEHKPGEQFAMFIGEAQGGFVKWEGGKITQQAWIRLADHDTDLEKLRASLGDNDPQQWKRFNMKGEPEDPFKESIRIPMIDPNSGSLFTFSSSAGSAVRAARKLVKNCLIQLKAAPETTTGHVPLVAIAVGSWTGQNGEVFFPRFEVVDWLPAGVVLHSLAKSGNAPAFGISNEDALNEDLGQELTPENTKPKSKTRM
jgi:hypothetical protein